MCQLFHPYDQLMSSFHKKFKGLFIARDSRDVLVPQESKAASFLQMAHMLSFAKPGPMKSLVKKIKQKQKRERNMKKLEKDNICRLRLADEKEVEEKKATFCSMYQPFDTTDDKRITNFAI